MVVPASGAPSAAVRRPTAIRASTAASAPTTVPRPRESLSRGVIAALASTSGSGPARPSSARSKSGPRSMENRRQLPTGIHGKPVRCSTTRRVPLATRPTRDAGRLTSGSMTGLAAGVPRSKQLDLSRVLLTAEAATSRVEEESRMSLHSGGSDERVCECSGDHDALGMFRWRGDPEWWSCACCDGRVRPMTDEEKAEMDRRGQEAR